MLIPDISCPWGCTDYIHKSGTVEFDVILQRLLLKCNIPWATSKTFKLSMGKTYAIVKKAKVLIESEFKLEEEKP